MTTPIVYQRILLKLSGEALMGEESYGIDPKVLDRIAHEVGELIKQGVQVGMVIGGGNICRGNALSKAGLGRVSADQMGTLATVMSAIAMRDALERAGFSTRIMSAIPMSGLVDHYDRRKAIHHLEQSRVVIFAAGTGNPLVTTDSAASLRAIETDADILLKATNVDGIYSADPALEPSATRYERVTYARALENELGIMDLSAFCQCRDHNMPIRVFNINHSGALMRIVKGEPEGTLVEEGAGMINDIQKDAKDRMSKSIKTLEDDLAKLRAGRAHPSLLDDVVVNYYGNLTPLRQVASVGIEGPLMLTVKPFEKKMVQEIEKAIRVADLGVNPATSGDVIRVPLPPLSEERRKELIKKVKSEGENTKVAVRNIRRDSNQDVKELLKEKEISEDEQRKAEDAIQKLTDGFITQIDELLAKKEKDLLEM